MITNETIPVSHPYSQLRILYSKGSAYFEKQGTIEVPSVINASLTESVTYDFFENKDLLHIGHSKAVFPFARSKILVREDYKDIWKLIEEDRATPDRSSSGIIVTGQPGIGKKIFLYYCIAKSLGSGSPVVFQDDNNGIYVFDKRGVHHIAFSKDTSILEIQTCLQLYDCKPNTLALVHSTEHSPEPASVLTNETLPFYVVQATSPHPTRWKDWSERRCPSLVVMKPWSWTEIFIGATHFCDRTISIEDLSNAFDRYGPNPRLCFNLAGDQRRAELYDYTLRAAVQDCTQPVKAAKCYGSLNSSSASPHLIQMIPSETGLPLTTITPYASGLLCDSLFATDKDGLYKLYKSMESNPLTRTGAENLYREIVFCKISSGEYRGSNLVKILTRSSFHLDVKGPVRQFPLGNSNTAEEGVFYRCKTPSFDGFSINKSVLYLWKMTLSSQNPLQRVDLDKLEDSLPSYWSPTNRSAYSYSRAESWVIVFVFPSQVQNGFKEQPIVGKGNPQRRWEDRDALKQCYTTLDLV